MPECVWPYRVFKDNGHDLCLKELRNHFAQNWHLDNSKFHNNELKRHVCVHMHFCVECAY
jgi:hypothetical protein